MSDLLKTLRRQTWEGEAPAEPRIRCAEPVAARQEPRPPDILLLSRRGFLKAGALTGGGLLLGVYLPVLDAAAKVPETKPKSFAPNAFVRIGTDGAVTVVINHSEMGQGTFTSLALLAAEELDADWNKVRAEHAPVDAAYNHVAFPIQMVGGSTSTWTEWERLRKAGATARAMLISAAAENWNVGAKSCSTESGSVIHKASGRRAEYGSLVENASTLKPPQDVALKDPKDFKFIGKGQKRLDTPDKTNGKAIFGLDVNLPGMLVAVVARPPVFGGKVKSFNADKSMAVRGVKQVVQIDRGVAVVANGFWAARLGREALQVEWDDGPLSQLNSESQREEYAALARQPGIVAKKEGDVEVAMKQAARTFDAVYELPYLAHATMEPMNAVADVRADGCDVWTGTQFQTGDKAATVRLTGLKSEQVNIHTTMLGGGFGRRAVIDSHFVLEAVEVSKAMKAPVKVIWTREDDMHGGYYRPRAYHEVRAAIDDAGKPVAWKHRIVCQSFIAGTPFEAAVIKDGVDGTAVEGAADMPYEIPNLFVDWKEAPGGVPTLWWRSVGHTHTAFVVETLIDELAHAAGKDPFEYRRALLEKEMRHKRVLELVAENAGWGKTLPEGRGRGIAVHESFGSFVAQVAEVSVSNRGKLRVHRVVCAVDCGPTVNPDGIRAQMESGVVFGLTAALYGEITFANGRVRQSNFHDYKMLRIDEMPVVKVHIVPSAEMMGGIGETGVPPIAPAVANALFTLTGKRIRRLPIRKEDLKA